MNPLRMPAPRTVSQAREQLEDIIGMVARGAAVTVKDERFTAAVVSAVELRELLAASVQANVEVGVEDGRWFAVMPGRPFAADGATQDEATQDLIDNLREYAIDWHDGLHTSPNHSENRNLVQLIGLSTDAQLREWFAV